MQIPRFPFVLCDVLADDVDELTAELFDLGAEGVEERDHTTLVRGRREGFTTLSASFTERADADAACTQIAQDPRAGAPEVIEVVGDDWRDAWKEHFRPFVVATRPQDGVAIAVRPPWVPLEEARTVLPGDLPEAKVRWLELEPGRAFGTGLHETTQLVSEALGGLALEGQAVLDVGTGSGILALIALAFGAASVRGTDNDPDAVAVSNENAQRNQLTGAATFSTDDVSTEQAGAWRFVLANIETHILVPMAEALAATVAPGGQLLLSGILATQEPQIRAAYEPLSLRHVGTTQRGEWVLVHFERA